MLQNNFLTVFFLLSFITSGAYAQNSTASKVDQIVAAEATGLPINRREALKDQSDEMSQWQGGRILVDGQWSNIESLHTDKLGNQAIAYRQQRDAIKTLDVEGHRRLAKWCQSHQLPEMAQIHWKAVIATAFDDEQARKALGHRRVGNNWLTTEELKRAAFEHKQDTACLKEWMPQIQKIVDKLQSSNTQTKLEGMKDLEKIDALAAVTALKYGAMQVESSIALPIVLKIKSIRSEASCLALCELAINNPHSEVGSLALAGLKEYDEHLYVPELLQMLETSVALKQDTGFTANGSFVIRRAYAQEFMTEKEQTEVLKLITLTHDQRLGITSSGLINHPGMRDFLNGKPKQFYWIEYFPQSAASLGRLTKIELQEANRQLAMLNEIKAMRVQNVKSVLAAISGLPSDEPVEAYWNWWPNFNENFTSFEKPTAYKYGFDDSNPAHIVRFFVDVTSCLIAGTPIQTASGLKPVEKLEIGDSVASVDVASGKTLLRPITYLSNRVAEATYVITLKNGEVIRATGGHYWWVVGKGWQRSRQLASGQYMRTTESSVEITSVEKIDEPIKVYNMIVDDSHTYFVGKNRLLSWDVTSLRPTLQTAPGQAKSTYVKKN